MTLDETTLQKLMAFADGELDDTERAEVLRLVQANPDAARVLAELDVLGQCVRVVEAARHIPIMTDAIMARIAAAPLEKSHDESNVVDLASRRRKTFSVVAALVAAAAGVFFMTREPSDGAKAPVAQKAPTPAVVAPAVPTPAETVAAVVPAAPSSSNVSVIVVPGMGEVAPSVVIWLGDDKAGGTK
ncbi:MAG: hypothetical protein IPG50_23735 [Myxococcales bacterium]|nr:hypothetical protein [Myxococcales bacterium]